MAEETSIGSGQESGSSQGSGQDSGTSFESSGQQNDFNTGQRDVSSEQTSGAGNGSATNANENSHTEQPKRESRYERTKRQKAALAQREATIRQREEAFANQERARQVETTNKPKRDYTLDDLKKYRKVWEDNGDFELVEKADAEIAEMEAEEKSSKRVVELPQPGTPEHKAQWESAERELYEADPEFMRQGTPLDSKLRDIMGGPDGDIYRGHPRGIVAAYHRARMELLEVNFKNLQTENQNLKTELKRFNGLTSVGGGAPGRVGNVKQVESLRDFSKLSTVDMRKHLLNKNGSGELPWL